LSSTKTARCLCTSFAFGALAPPARRRNIGRDRCAVNFIRQPESRDELVRLRQEALSPNPLKLNAPNGALPQEFAYPAAFGDLITAIIAFAAIPFVLRRSGLAKPIVWAFNIFGTVDLLAAITTATIYNAPVAMGPAYWIPAVAVPLLLVAHYVTFVLLLRRWES